MKFILKKAHGWVMALVAAEMNTKQNSNASIVQEMKEQILVSSAFNHSILKKREKKKKKKENTDHHQMSV